MVNRDADAENLASLVEKLVAENALLKLEVDDTTRAAWQVARYSDFEKRLYKDIENDESDNEETVAQLIVKRLDEFYHDRLSTITVLRPHREFEPSPEGNYPRQPNRLMIIAHRGLPSAARHHCYGFDGLLGLVYRKKATQREDDLQNDPLYQEQIRGTPFEEIQRANQSALIVPIITANREGERRVRYLINLESTGPHAFTDDDVRMLESVAEFVAARYKTTKRSQIDDLTGLVNRKTFMNLFNTRWDEALSKSLNLGVMELDLNKFKLVNDTYGHQAGDDVLGAVAEGLRTALHRHTDVISRFGGDEFWILLPGTKHEYLPKITSTIQAHLLHALRPLSKRYDTQELPFPIVTPSLGAAEVQEYLKGGHEQDPDKFLNYVDHLMYRNKRGER